MERISIFNYEAFYLDFLEGNLNEEDTALLMAFFEENPDLKIDDLDLPTFNEEHHVLHADLKNELKQPDLSDQINAENVDHFMIANAENLLSADKEQELKEFVEANASLKSDHRLYQAVYFEVDDTIVYENKEGLKRKTIILWPYAASIAAIAIIAFLLIWGAISGSGTETSNNVLAEDNGENIENTQVQFNNAAEKSKPVVEDESPVDNNSQIEENYQRVNSNETPVQNNNQEKTIINSMERVPAGNVLTALNNINLEPVTVPSFQKPRHEEGGSEALASATLVNNMENPIEPITKFVADKTNREVDFQRTKKNVDPKEGKGFFLKIGKFEFSRKKH